MFSVRRWKAERNLFSAFHLFHLSFSVYLSVCLSSCRHLSHGFSLCSCVCLSVCLSVCLWVCLSDSPHTLPLSAFLSSLSQPLTQSLLVFFLCNRTAWVLLKTHLCNVISCFQDPIWYRKCFSLHSGPETLAEERLSQHIQEKTPLPNFPVQDSKFNINVMSVHFGYVFAVKNLSPCVPE